MTSTYIGPDRRRDSARGSEIALLTVPNTLRAKAAEGLLGGNTQEIEAAQKQVHHQRLRQNALRLGIGAKLVAAHAASRARAAAIEEELVQLAASAEEIQRRLGDPDFAGLASACESAFAAIVEIREGLSDPKTASAEALSGPLAKLNELCLAVHKTVVPDRDPAEIQADIEQTAAKIQARPMVKAPLARAAKG